MECLQGVCDVTSKAWFHSYHQEIKIIRVLALILKLCEKHFVNIRKRARAGGSFIQSSRRIDCIRQGRDTNKQQPSSLRLRCTHTKTSRFFDQGCGTARYFTCSVCSKIDGFLFGYLSHPNRKPSVPPVLCLLLELTGGQGETSKEKDKCQEEQGGAVNNAEAIPGEPGKRVVRSP